MTVIKLPPHSQVWKVKSIDDLDDIFFFAAHSWRSYHDPMLEEEDLPVQLEHILDSMSGVYSIVETTEDDCTICEIRKHSPHDMSKIRVTYE